MREQLIKGAFGNFMRFTLLALMAFLMASCGGGGGSPGAVGGQNGEQSGGSTTGTAGSVALIFSNPELKSAGTAGSEVTVTALIKTPGNIALEGIPVTFSADSGVLTVVDAASDQNGQAKALLSTADNHTNRKITVTAQAGGITVSGSVDVVGTSVILNGPSTISVGSAEDFTVTVKDSANDAVTNVPVTFSSKQGNSIAVVTSAGGTATTPLTNSQGQVVLRLTASHSGSDTISVSAQGASTSSVINVNSSTLAVNIFDSNGNIVTTANTSTSCQKIGAHYEVSGVPQGGAINISTSRGRLYSDNTCTTLLVSSSVPLVAGDSQAIYLKSDTAGVSTITASIPGGISAETDIEFIAALTNSATISLQAEPAIIGTNAAGGQSEKSTLTAVVRDGTTNNNLVKGARVEFSIINDPSGGALSAPAVVTTGSDGTASATFFAGTASTPANGVTIRSTIQQNNVSNTTTLTVSKKSLFITVGTGNKLGTPDDTTYQQDYTVFVTDASGNPVSGATVTAAMRPTRYFKGTYSYSDADKIWKQNVVADCSNEDINQDGVLDAGEDYNENGKLDPGAIGNVTASAVTDATGTATISVRYPRDRAQWAQVQLTVRGSVAGTESIDQLPPYILPVLSSDLTDKSVDPPGVTSPYGVNACNLKD